MLIWGREHLRISGHRFIRDVHHMFDVPFRITEVQLSYLHGTQFLVQYEGTIDSFPLGSSDFREMLTGCDAICPTES